MGQIHNTPGKGVKAIQGSFCPVAFLPKRVHPFSMTLLQKRDQLRRQRRLEVYEQTRRELRQALASLIPNCKVILFGSLTKPGVFNDHSDIDLALESDPPQMDCWQLMSELSERLRRPVDVIRLDKCRFREKILREGEIWIA